MDSLDEPRHDKVLYQLESSSEYFASNDIMTVEIPEEYRKPGETAFQLASVNFANPKLSWNFPADKILRKMAGIKVPEDEEKPVPNTQSSRRNTNAVSKNVNQVTTNEARVNWRNKNNFPYNHKHQNSPNFMYAPMQQPDWMPAEIPSSSAAALKSSTLDNSEQRWPTSTTQPSANLWPPDGGESPWQQGEMYPPVRPQQSRNIQSTAIPPPSEEWQSSEVWAPPEARPSTNQWQHEEIPTQNDDWQSSEVTPHMRAQTFPPMVRRRSGRAQFKNKWHRPRRPLQSQRGHHNHSEWDGLRNMGSTNSSQTRTQDNSPPEPRHFPQATPMQQVRHFQEAVSEGSRPFNQGRGNFHSRNFNNQSRFSRNRFQGWRRPF